MVALYRCCFKKYHAKKSLLLTQLNPNPLFVHKGHRPKANSINIKLMKGKALRKHSLHEKTAALVLLKLFISSNE